MGIMRKAAIGSLIAGLGAVALARNRKSAAKIKKNVTKAAKKVMHSSRVKKGLSRIGIFQKKRTK